MQCPETPVEFSPQTSLISPLTLWCYPIPVTGLRVSQQSSQLSEEQVIHALMKKLPKEQRIDMLINMEQDF